MAFFKRKKKTISPIPLNDLLNQVSNILVDQQEEFFIQQIKRIDKLFDEDGAPKYKIIKTEQKKTVSVPLLSLVTPRILDMQEFDISFEAPLTSTDKKRIKEEQGKLSNDELTVDYSDSKYQKGMVSIRFKYRKKEIKNNIFKSEI